MAYKVFGCDGGTYVVLDAIEMAVRDGARVINMSTVNPLDETSITEAAKTGAILTVEEHSVRGGLGGAVSEVVTASDPVPMRIMGFPGFLPTGSAEWLLDHFGLTAQGIAGAALELIARKRK